MIPGPLSIRAATVCTRPVTTPGGARPGISSFTIPRQNCSSRLTRCIPNKATGDLNAAVFHRGRRLHQIRKMDFNVAAEPAQERLSSANETRRNRGIPQWRLRYDAEEFCADLLFTAVHPPFSWAAANLWLETSKEPGLGSHHFDQLGRYSGSVWLGERELKIHALGFRDRMWGWGGRKHWQSYLIMWAAFNEDCVADVAIQRFNDGRQTLSGYLHLDGASGLLRNAAVALDWNPSRWKTLARADIRVEDALGRSFEFSGQPQGILDTGHRWPHRNDHGVQRRRLPSRTQRAWCDELGLHHPGGPTPPPGSVQRVAAEDDHQRESGDCAFRRKHRAFLPRPAALGDDLPDVQSARPPAVGQPLLL